MSEKKSTLPIDDIVNNYIKAVVSQKSELREHIELEAKFATIGNRRISYIDYNNVIKKLLSQGFVIGPKKEFLRVFNEVSRMGGSSENIRTEISGIANISKYCKTNVVDPSMKAMFDKKIPVIVDGNKVNNVDNRDFNFRVSLQKEKLFSEDDENIQTLLSEWSNKKKMFRYISRNTLTHKDFPVKIDVSIIKNSKKRGRQYIPEYNFIDSGTLTSSESYEIEIEVDNEQILNMLAIVKEKEKKQSPLVIEKFISVELVKNLKKNIKFVLCGLQETNYPVSYPEQDSAVQDYMRILWKDKYKEETRVYPKNFIGPSQLTLQMQNIIPTESNIDIPNIRTNYTVTEKADGTRKLLFINSKGKIYFITTNMTVQFTGSQTPTKAIYNTIIDGEHIIHDKKKNFINMYAAFDIYYLDQKDLRALPFIKMDETPASRLQLLSSLVSSLKASSVIKGKPSPINVSVKTFYTGDKDKSIFNGCKTILDKEKNGEYLYETDGLIFTPSFMGVGTNEIGKTTKFPVKTTWENSFKWKPVEFNTIDFLVQFEKSEDGQDKIGYKFQSGINTHKNTQITQYKTAILRVGYDERKHGYINPCKNIIDGDFPDRSERDDNSTYKPVRFYPTNPSDDDAGKCHLMLQESPTNDKIIKTEENEIIEDNMIVEFKYVMENPDLWKWVPLRVRYDKTADLRNTGRNFGNAYHVANSNWHSIHNPITNEMISSGNDIPDSIVDEQVYYNVKSGDSLTKGLRQFHNMFVKKTLIENTASPDNILIDLAVGKGGDMHKWYGAKLRFVFGIDLSSDNLNNRIDGACARYLTFRKKFYKGKNSVFNALFVHGNSAANIRNTAGIFNDKGKQITNAVFGQVAKNQKELGKGVYDVYGIGEKGFDICSIQFAIHYMFQNQNTLQNLLRNVSETTKVGGYFIGTCYDGKKIFELLSKKQLGESDEIFVGDKKIWSITKEYSQQEFTNDESSLGYAINVYQESINKTFQEYLVNFDYLTRLMENYGFVPISNNEAKQMNIPSGIGSFKTLYDNLREYVKRVPSKEKIYKEALNMSANEKKISFLNNYFVYKKVRQVDSGTIYRNELGESVEEEKVVAEETEKAQEAAEEQQEIDEKKQEDKLTEGDVVIIKKKVKKGTRKKSVKKPKIKIVE